MILFTAVLSLHQENLNKTSTKCGVVWCGVVWWWCAVHWYFKREFSVRCHTTPHHTTMSRVVSCQIQVCTVFCDQLCCVIPLLLTKPFVLRCSSRPSCQARIFASSVPVQLGFCVSVIDWAYGEDDWDTPMQSRESGQEWGPHWFGQKSAG